MKNIKLTLTAVNGGEKSRFLYLAELRGLQKGFLIKYNAEDVTVSLLYHGDRLTVQRTDGTLLRFKVGESEPGRYATGPFFSPVTVSTHVLTVGDGRLEVVYTVDFSGETVKNVLLFEWVDEPAVFENQKESLL